MSCCNTPLGVLVIAIFTGAAPSALAQRAPTPLTEHDVVRKDLGKWKASKMRYYQPPSEGTGVAEVPLEIRETNVLWGDHWLLTEVEGDYGDGRKFSTKGQFGYDADRQKFVGTWILNLDPVLHTMEGTYDPATATLTMTSSGRDSTTSEIVEQKFVTRYVGDDTKVMESYAQDSEGQEYKMMEIRYKRGPKYRNIGVGRETRAE